MTQFTLYEAGYLVRVTSYENDGDNCRTVEKRVLTREDVEAYKKIFDLFNHHDVGNIFDADAREMERMQYAFEDFAELNPDMFPNSEIKLYNVIMPLAEEIGLAGHTEYFTRSPETFEAFYFEHDVIAEKII